MFYIYKTSCISPQSSYGSPALSELVASAGNKLMAQEPVYSGIPPGILRRMGKAVRIGIGAALPLIADKQETQGIIIGTANGGMEDCIKFLNQIIEYDEGKLTPTNFVQSTPNAIAGQLGLMQSNKGYNITHSNRGLSFENALMDVDMLLAENKNAKYLVGAVDEISAYNFRIEWLGGWYKSEDSSNLNLFENESDGSIAGEGAAMFLAGNEKQGSICRLTDIHFFQTDSAGVVKEALTKFLAKHLPSGKSPDLFMSGENGDRRMQKYYEACTGSLAANTPVLSFKQMCGEYPTASSFGAWAACEILRTQEIPMHMLRTSSSTSNTPISSIFIYNTYKGNQHSFMLLEK
ncbi:MAG: beta-ketoacyl synthase chain length factor [Gemmatimonadaceae bacterium]|nr:beta-ketoacyl synthase chain length factor [Chitinophagaceae bacterium]